MINVNSLDALLGSFDTRPLATPSPVSSASANPTANPTAAVPNAPGATSDRSVLAALIGRFIDGESLSLPDLLLLAAGDNASPRAGTQGGALARLDGDAAAAASQGEGATDVRAAAQSGPQAPTPSLPNNPAVSTRLSDVAMWLAGAPAQGPVAPGTIRATLPLLPSPTLLGTEISHALQHAVGKSGLFYESHVAAWAVQDYPKQALSSEPQARAGLALKFAAPDSEAGAKGAADEAAVPTSVHDPLPPLVREQLHALESRSVAWNGELWPGQAAGIVIAEERSDDSGAPTPETTTWKAQVKLHLPELGGIELTLSLAGDRLRVRIDASEAGAAQKLRASAGDFAGTMRRRDLLLETLAIENAPPRS